MLKQTNKNAIQEEKLTFYIIQVKLSSCPQREVFYFEEHQSSDIVIFTL